MIHEALIELQPMPPGAAEQLPQPLPTALQLSVKALQGLGSCCNPACKLSGQGSAARQREECQAGRHG